MKLTYFFKMLSSSILLILTTSMSLSQNLVVTLIDSNKITFPVSDIQSIKFEANSMILHEVDGTTNNWDINDIDNYSFDKTTGLAEEINTIKENAVIFPNPATNQVNIQFTTNQGGKIKIDVLDMSGRLIEHVYSGEHSGKKLYEWHSENIMKGIYLCRIISGNKVITKPIVTR